MLYFLLNGEAIQKTIGIPEDKYDNKILEFASKYNIDVNCISPPIICNNSNELIYMVKKQFGIKPYLIIATTNIGKKQEYKNALGEDDYIYLDIKEVDVEETGKTYEENSMLKAETVSYITGRPAIGDDSGLEINSLDGFPGLYSARCAGENATDEDKVSYILEKMKDVEDRSASFVCSISYCDYINNIKKTFTHRCDGYITREPRGIAKKNLQYDTIFFSPELGFTFAEVKEEVKAEVSHRGKTIKQLKEFLKGE